MTLTLTSTAFNENGNIPEKYTCEGKDVSPQLAWNDPPMGTESFVLICDDHDVPKNLKADGVWDHWVVFNMPSSTRVLEEDIKNFPTGTVVGKNSDGSNIYKGPCPPDREHRYTFKLYALDCKLNLDDKATKTDVEHAMERHVLAQTVLAGLYNKRERRLHQS